MDEYGYIMKTVYTALGFVGAGISVGARLGRGEKLNKWSIYTTLGAGAIAGGTSTEALVVFFNIPLFWAGGVAVLLGITAMGFVLNAIDGKIPFINRFMGGKENDGKD